jgi:hypothetical protein
VTLNISFYSYLANFYLKRRRLEEAYYHAQKCTEFNETREMGKSLLRQIAHLRALDSTLATAGNATTSSVDIADTSVAANDRSIGSNAWCRAFILNFVLFIVSLFDIFPIFRNE